MDSNFQSPSVARDAAGFSVPGDEAQCDPSGPPVLRAAVEYLDRGLRPVPLHAKGEMIVRNGKAFPSSGKEPIGAGWGRRAHTKASLRQIYAENPLRGVGLQLGLGPGGEDGIFDLEIDDEFQSQFTLIRIFGEPRPPETLRYGSLRGEHSIYRLRAGDAAQLRELGITKATIDGKNHASYRGIELRFGTLDPDEPRETQSVAPPTPYERSDGTPVPRQWEGTSIAPFPSLLMIELAAHFGRRTGTGRRLAEPPSPPRDDDRTPVELFLHQVAAMGLAVEEYSGGWKVQCPVHPDNNPSLSVRAADDGRLLVRCFGCDAPYAEIMAAVGLKPGDGFPRGRPRAGAAHAPGDADVRSVFGGPVREVDDATAERFARDRSRSVEALMLRPDKRDELARRLAVSPSTFIALDVGWREDWEKDDEDRWFRTGRWAWVFPEVDGRGRVVGLLRRYEDKLLKKKLVAGGRRGLIVPSSWRKRPGPILLCEGASDTAALVDLGRCAIGRPQAKAESVLSDLAGLLQGDPRGIVIAADNDAVGRAGAEVLARELSSDLGREVRVLPPLPPGVKDLRQLVASFVTTGGPIDGK